VGVEATGKPAAELGGRDITFTKKKNRA